MGTQDWHFQTTEIFDRKLINFKFTHEHTYAHYLNRDIFEEKITFGAQVEG